MCKIISVPRVVLSAGSKNSGLPSQIQCAAGHLYDLVMISTFEATKKQNQDQMTNDSRIFVSLYFSKILQHQKSLVDVFFFIGSHTNTLVYDV
jgi:hypothetical protein